MTPTFPSRFNTTNVLRPLAASAVVAVMLMLMGCPSASTPTTPSRTLPRCSRNRPMVIAMSFRASSFTTGSLGSSSCAWRLIQLDSVSGAFSNIDCKPLTTTTSRGRYPGSNTRYFRIEYQWEPTEFGTDSMATSSWATSRCSAMRSDRTSVLA